MRRYPGYHRTRYSHSGIERRVMSLLDTLIPGTKALRRVTRRAAGSRVGGRFVEGAIEIAMVRMDVQTAKTSLTRVLAGDSSTGAVDIWATAEQLAGAYLEGDVAETPLGWTELTIAPPKGTEGPPGDRVEWLGRAYEITGVEPHDETGPLLGSFRKYSAEDRGAA